MTAPVVNVPGVPAGAQVAVLVAWDDGAEEFVVVQSNSSGALASTATLTTGDIQIGAVEIKNDTTDTRAQVGAGTAANGLRVVLASDDPGVALLGTIDADTSILATAAAAPSTGAITSVGDEVSSTTILAANASRKGATFYNDSGAILYLALANTTASSTVYTVQIPGGGYFELPVSQGGVYTGICVGIWASDAGGAVRVTELT